MDQPPTHRRQFGSDNHAGMCPEAFEGFARARDGHATAYGDDPWTAEAVAALREVFEIDCDVFFVFNGTAANSLALAACGRSYHGVICHEAAHLHTDECAAPEFFTGGSKLVPLPGSHGKLTPEIVRSAFGGRNDVHTPRAATLSLTQATELGTVYTPDEIAALSETARSLGLRVHMDGARFANAVASLGVAPKELTWQAGVDILCFGGTKMGLPGGEAMVFFNRALAAEFPPRRKQAGQLASKMRFLTAPWTPMLCSGAWLRHAAHANAMAAELAKKLDGIEAARMLMPREANAVFVDLPIETIDTLHAQGWHFYPFVGRTGVRLMCSWDTQPEDIDAFVTDLRRALP
jgi:threonine aldolase